MTQQASAATWYVDGSVPSPRDGRSWRTAINTTETAIVQAGRGDKIAVDRHKGSGSPSTPPLRWALPGTIGERTILMDFGAEVGRCEHGVVFRHAGIDVSVAVGENVYAPEVGTVRAITYNANRHGFEVSIEHSGFTTFLTPVRPFVGVGDPVTRSQIVATTARTPWCCSRSIELGPDTCLHIGIRVGGYSEISNRLALPESGHDGDPAFPECFVDLKSLGYQERRTWFVDDDMLDFPQADFTAIRAALDAGSSGDTVVVSPGTYVENVQFNAKDIVLQSTNPSEPKIVASTVIDGNRAGAVVTFSGTEGETCFISGFTIRNGKSRDGAGVCGGQLSGPRCRAAIRSNIIRDNGENPMDRDYCRSAVCWCDGAIEGNRIIGNWAAAVLQDCCGQIRDNVIAGNGGGLVNCGAIIRNIVCANSGTGLFGCGPVENSVICGNAGPRVGGLLRCGTVANNLITGNYGYVGGLCECLGTIRDNTITANRGSRAGALGGCSGAIYNCVIWANSTPALAPTALAPQSEPTYSCVQEWAGDPATHNVAQDPRFIGAVATGKLSGAAVFDEATCQTTVEDSAAPWLPNVFVNLIIIVRNCRFVIASNSNTSIKLWGDASTIAGPGDTYIVFDHRLRQDSPCIDAGKNEDWMWSAVDLGGNPRIFFAGKSLTVDMGAYEHGSFPFRIKEMVRASGGGLELTWISRPGDTYIVWSCLDLSTGAWVQELTLPSRGDTTQWTDPAPPGQGKFYRVETKQWQ